MDVAAFNVGSPGSFANAWFELTNRGSRPAYLGACGDHVVLGVERRIANRWEDYVGSRCLHVAAMESAVLQPRESRRDSWSRDTPGTCRLRVYFGESDVTRWQRSTLGDPFELR